MTKKFEVNSNRNYGIDLLRILSMFMVVMLHVLGLGGILDNTYLLSANYAVAWFLEIASLCAVNCYALISGYVGYTSKHRCSSLINLSITVLFYILAITAVVYAVCPSVGIRGALSSLLHIRNGAYWYYRAYVGAFFFFPLLNIVVDKADKDQLKKALIAILFLFSVVTMIIRNDLFSVIGGYSPLWLMVLYLLGAYMKKYGLAENKKSSKGFLVYGSAVVVTWLSLIFIAFVTKKIFGRAVLEAVLANYTSPTIIISAIGLLVAFSNLNINKTAKRVISFLSPLAFSVYLIHMQYFIRGWIDGRFVFASQSNAFMLAIYAILLTFAIYVVCIVIDYVRHIIFKLLRIKQISVKIAKKIGME